MERIGLFSNMALFISSIMFCTSYSDIARRKEEYDMYVKNKAENKNTDDSINNKSKMQFVNYYLYDCVMYDVPILRIKYLFDEKPQFMHFYKNVMIKIEDVDNNDTHIHKELTLENVNNDIILFETYKTLF